MIRVIINRVIKSVIRHSDKNLNNVTFSGIASSRTGLGRAYELYHFPIISRDIRLIE
ncbi:hypothetical protein [Candidatus Tisiphia endosymbiont of Beris chalybata]|uniref:hypothetical protein n=1 Tax=Candidatus Tisiphia endosymbiont of Beris chalybata TaxID=3066262 RepID=UPI00312C8F3E